MPALLWLPYLLLIFRSESGEAMVVSGDEADVDEEDGIDVKGEGEEEEEEMPELGGCLGVQGENSIIHTHLVTISVSLKSTEPRG